MPYHDSQPLITIARELIDHKCHDLFYDDDLFYCVEPTSRALKWLGKQNATDEGLKRQQARLSDQQSGRKPLQHNTRHPTHAHFTEEGTQISTDCDPTRTASIALLSFRHQPSFTTSIATIDGTFSMWPTYIFTLDPTTSQSPCPCSISRSSSEKLSPTQGGDQGPPLTTL